MDTPMNNEVVIANELIWQIIKSSNVDAIAYDEQLNELHVRFKGGAHYAYEVPSMSVYSDLMVADSVGGFLNKNIKNKYKFRKVS